MGLKEVFKDYDAFEATVVKELRTKRKGAKISLKEMSDKIGLHVNTIAKCERQESGLGLEILFGYAKVLGLSVDSFISRHEVRVKPDGNPVAELTEEEMFRYSQLLQGIFNAFSEQGIKLSGGRSFDATRLAAMAILENRQVS